MKHLTSKQVGGRGEGCLQVAYRGSVMVVVFCKKLPQLLVGDITFYKGNE